MKATMHDGCWLADVEDVASGAFVQGSSGAEQVAGKSWQRNCRGVVQVLHSLRRAKVTAGVTAPEFFRRLQRQFSCHIIVGLASLADEQLLSSSGNIVASNGP